MRRRIPGPAVTGFRLEHNFPVIVLEPLSDHLRVREHGGQRFRSGLIHWLLSVVLPLLRGSGLVF